ncbi:hypothetical protein KTH_47570 [Thermosporothrix hazakensis]|jgi:hypothetical protein|nr:hypothetical protein KTH_47570 [Thermosporothrix hazakensis]
MISHTYHAVPLQAKRISRITGQVVALVKVELLMQWRRRGFWLAFAGATIIFILLTGMNLSIQVSTYLTKVSSQEAAHFIIFTRFSFFTGLSGFVAGLLVVDRIVRDQRLGLADIQQATSLHTVCYVLGKFCGNCLAVMVPCVLSFLLFLSVYLVAGVTVGILLPCLLALCVVLLPACLLIVAFVLFFASLVPLRMAQIGFPLLWIWAILAPLGWPSIATTILSPTGYFAVGYWFYTSGVADSSQQFTLTNAIANLVAVPTLALLLLLLLALVLEILARISACA